jgi:hypothetical protein
LSLFLGILNILFHGRPRPCREDILGAPVVITLR